MTSPSILVTWFGSIHPCGTVGDLFAVQSVISRLVASGFDVFHASETSTFGLQGRNVSSINMVDPREVDLLIFVCGPIIKGNPICQIFERFAPSRKIGVSVSLMANGAPNYTQPFDIVFAREGGSRRYEDVAILAPLTSRRLVDSQRVGIRVGLALRGPQGEYGECLDGTVRKLAESAVNTLSASRPVDVVEIEHHLVRSGRTPPEIEGLYAGCDLIITSRFHGGMLALRNTIPFIAIDQIRGGAKISSLLKPTGWPYVFRADSVAIETICAAAEHLVAVSSVPLLCETADRCRRAAGLTLDALEAEIRGL